MNIGPQEFFIFLVFGLIATNIIMALWSVKWLILGICAFATALALILVHGGNLNRE